MNLSEIIQSNLHYPPIKKIDPNTSAPKNEEEYFEPGSLAQAAIPVTILGLLQYLDGNQLKTEDLKTESNELEIIFGDKFSEIVSHVAKYAGENEEHAKHEMNLILTEAIRLIKESEKNKSQSIHHLVKFIKADTILYLPVSLHAGLLLGDDFIDDSTRKMEGPISNMVHGIEKRFM